MGRQASAVICWLALIGSAAAQQESGAASRDGTSRPLATPSWEHPGQPLRIPEPEKGQATAVGRSAEVTEPVAANGRAALMGTVEAVSRAGDSIRIRDSEGMQHELALTRKTRVIHNRKRAGRTAIKSGAEVNVAYRRKADRLVAEKVELLQPPSVRKKAEASQAH